MMSTLYTHPGVTGPHDCPNDAYPTFTDDGREVGMHTLEQAISRFGDAEYDPETRTITAASGGEELVRD